MTKARHLFVVTGASEGAPGAEGTLHFGDCRLDRDLGVLLIDGAEVWLPPKVLTVLEYLLQRPGAVISRTELLASVWNDTVAMDHCLTETVRALRQALGDDPRRPRYIQTVHRRGYRFVAPLRLEYRNTALSFGGRKALQSPGAAPAIVGRPD